MPHVVYLHSALTATSFGIPFALVPLVLITRSRHIMGVFAIGRWTASVMWLVTATITGLNVVLLWQFAV
jgi:manganese transport protein